jgi:hypothetical protein
VRGRIGVTIDGVKITLAIEEGSTENATLVTALIVVKNWKDGPMALRWAAQPWSEAGKQSAA